MKKIKLFILVLIALISQDIFCQEDSVVVTKYNENYVEIKSLRFVLDSGYSFPTGEYVMKSFIPRPITLKDGIVLIKDRNNKPLNLLFYSDSICVQNNYFYDGRLGDQEFKSDKNVISISIRWNNDNTFHSILYLFKKKKMVVQYEDKKTPLITIVPW